MGDWEGVSDGGGDLNVNTFQKEWEQKNRNLKILHFFTQKEHLPAQNPKFIVKKQKINVPGVILIFCWATLQLVQNIKPIRNLFCTASSCSDLSIYLIYNIYKFHQI